MRMCKNSLHCLERRDLRLENAEGPLLPFHCLHHCHRATYAMESGPANITAKLLPEHVVQNLQTACT